MTESELVLNKWYYLVIITIESLMGKKVVQHTITDNMKVTADYREL